MMRTEGKIALFGQHDAAFAGDEAQQGVGGTAFRGGTPGFVPGVELSRRRLGDARDQVFYRTKGHLCFWFNNQSRQKLQISWNYTTATGKKFKVRET